jgi:excisionase family DNA binding protein
MAIPAEVMLTPTEAAELLGLSRPFVARLLERGDIPSELLPESRHRRIKLEDVLAFQDRRERRSEGRRRIADIAATADLPYLCLLFVTRHRRPGGVGLARIRRARAGRVADLETWSGGALPPDRGPG